MNNHSQLIAYRRNVSLTVFLDGRSVRFTESMSSCASLAMITKLMKWSRSLAS
ncbi:Uncharacterised protein [Vibrio cholerae]|nr:Uncharacterised protein [Vibrio cholerae]